MSNTGARILHRCEEVGLSLRAACEKADVAYATLHQQITKGREIPFSFADKLAPILDTEISYFSDRNPFFDARQINGSKKSTNRAVNKNSRLARMELEAASDENAPTTDDILDWLQSDGKDLSNFHRFSDYVDLYHPVEATDQFPMPFHLGPKGLMSKYFLLNNVDDYKARCSQFSPETLAGVTELHFEIQQSEGYRVAEVTLTEMVEDRILAGSYRRVTSQVLTPSGLPANLVFGQLRAVYSR